MFGYKIMVLVLVFWNSYVTAETAKRDLIGQQSGPEFLELGNFGPISKLPSHPLFSHLGLTHQQILGFVNVLLQNGLLNYNSLRRPNGPPLWNGAVFGAPNGNFFGPLVPLDPYILFLMFNYPRFLPFGLGPQGFYGSTGVPRSKPLGVFKYNDKNS